MSALIKNFAFEEKLVRVVEIAGQPWFAGKDICAALDIRDHNQALENLDDDERSGCSVPTPSAANGRGGGEQTMIVVSMPGVFRLIFRSRKPEAERFKRWLAHEVLPEIAATGSYRGEGAPQPVECVLENLTPEHMAVLRLGLDIAKEARIQHGAARARLLWPMLGLPAVPEAPGLPAPEAAMEGKQVLETIMAAHLAGSPVLHMLAAAADGEEDATALLDGFGIHLAAGGIFVSNASAGIGALFPGIGWVPALRRLPGAHPAERRTFAGRQSRTTFVQLDY